MAMLLLTALAAAVVMVSSTEVKIAGNYNNGQETLYAADAPLGLGKNSSPDDVRGALSDHALARGTLTGRFGR